MNRLREFLHRPTLLAIGVVMCAIAVASFLFDHVPLAVATLAASMLAMALRELSGVLPDDADSSR